MSLLVVVNVGEAVKVTAPPYVCVPTVVIAVVFMSVMPLDSDASGVVPPTIPSKLVLPLPVTVVKAKAPLTVLSNVMSLLVVVNVVPELNVTAPLYVCVPTVVMPVVFMSVMPLDSDASGVVPPTIPSKLVLPLPVTVVKPKAPLTVLSNVMSLLVVVNVVPELNVTAPLYVCVPTVVMPVVFMSVMPLDSDASGVVPPTMPSKLVLPLPVTVVKANAPLTVLSNVMSLLVVVNVVPELNVTAPVYVCVPTVVTPVVFMSVMPLDSDARGVVPPTMPSKLVLPLPVTVVKANAPSTVLSNVMSLLVVVNVVPELNVTAPVYVCVPTVVMAVVFMSVMPLDSDARGVVPPTIPSKMVLPLPVTVVKPKAPSTVLSNVMSLLVVVNVVPELNVTAPVYVCVPTVVTPVVFMSVMPLDSDARGVVPPTIPSKFVLPVPVLVVNA